MKRIALLRELVVNRLTITRKESSDSYVRRQSRALEYSDKGGRLLPTEQA